jgi:hypothetical protein
MPVSVNECNLQEACTIAPTEYVSGEMFTCGKNPDSASNRPVVIRFKLI